MSDTSSLKEDISQSETKPPRLLHEFFEIVADRYPERIAIDTPPGEGRPERRQLSYGSMRRQSCGLAAFLRPYVCSDAIVAVMLPRNSEALYVCQLGILKAGAAYTCIDPSLPNERAAYILRDSEAVALLTDAEGRRRASELGIDSNRVFDVEEGFDWACLIETAQDFPSPEPSNLAYQIYTSGTTGKPKGVMIEHAAICNLVAGNIGYFELGPADRVTQSASSAWDSSVEEIWLALSVGATLVVMDDDVVRSGPDIIEWLDRERITMFNSVPTQLQSTGCLDPEKRLPDLQYLYLGGEALPQELANRWARCCRLFNGYGPTETTVVSARSEVLNGQEVSIGRPVPGMNAWVLNEDLEEVVAGERGELCMGGVGLARGYNNSPELTEEKFPTHQKFGRIYRTGDLVHHDASGDLFYHGRIDSQIKLRGYRIELGDVESHLALCSGVREAACAVQQNGSHAELVAFIVPEDDRNPPERKALRAELGRSLPSYMVPARIETLSDLPKSASGKLDRSCLPVLQDNDEAGEREITAPKTDFERIILESFENALSRSGSISTDDNFFLDLGGDSLRAAMLISILRENASTQSLTVRDIYEAPTIEALAKRVIQDFNGKPIDDEDTQFGATEGSQRPMLVTTAQIALLVTPLLVGSMAGYALVFKFLPFFIGAFGWNVSFLLAGPLLGLVFGIVYTPYSVLFLVAVKRLLVGEYRPMRAPVWSGFYLRHWIVQMATKVVPWGFLSGTVFTSVVLRFLGARVGKRVHFHRGVDLSGGGWDLLEIGDDVTVGQEASLRTMQLVNGFLVVGPVSVGDRCTLERRSGLSSSTRMEDDSFLDPLASLETGQSVARGERWAGVPAKPVGPAPDAPEPDIESREFSPTAHGLVVMLVRIVLPWIISMPFVIMMLGLIHYIELDPNFPFAWIDWLEITWRVVALVVAVVVILGWFGLLFNVLLIRLMGRETEGVMSRWSLRYIRVWLKTGLLNTAGKTLSGTLMWPIWLRMAGMKIGRGCELSTIIDVVPELIQIGEESFFADGIYLGGPFVHRGRVSLANTRLGRDSFLGNHVVIESGQRLPDGILIGVCTVSDDRRIKEGESWFGNPTFLLPKREIVEVDRGLTHEPNLARRLTRIFWEQLRFTLPVLPLALGYIWLTSIYRLGSALQPVEFLFLFLPLFVAGLVAIPPIVTLALKWVLLGRVKPGQHALWSSWCCRWDFLYVAWDVYARGPLMAFAGTLLAGWYLRAMGMKIGKLVVLNPAFAQVVDPDMLTIEDGATVSCLFQAHTFEDRVLKIDHVRIRKNSTVQNGAVLLYGADIGEGTRLSPHSVVMKRERLLPGKRYSGCPTRGV